MDIELKKEMVKTKTLRIIRCCWILSVEYEQCKNDLSCKSFNSDATGGLIIR